MGRGYFQWQQLLDQLGRDLATATRWTLVTRTGRWRYSLHDGDAFKKKMASSSGDMGTGGAGSPYASIVRPNPLGRFILPGGLKLALGVAALTIPDDRAKSSNSHANSSSCQVADRSGTLSLSRALVTVIRQVR